MGNVVVIRPNAIYKIVKCDDVISLDKMQELVGGYICVALRVPKEHSALGFDKKFDSNTVMFCDEDGYHKGLYPTIRRVTDGHMLVGNVVVTGYKPIWHEDGPDEQWTTLQDDQEKAIVSWLKGLGFAQLVFDETGDD